MLHRAGMLVLVLLCFAPATASAGTYEVWSCADEQGRPVPADGWEAPTPGGHVLTGDSCARGGGLDAALNGRADVPANTRAYWVFRAPAGTTVESARVWRSVRVSAGGPQAIPAYSAYFDDGIDAYGPQLEFCHVQLETPCSARGSGPRLSNAQLLRIPSVVPDRRALWFDLGCEGSGACPATGQSDMGAIRIHRAAIRLQDDKLPAFINAPSGALTTPVPLSGVQSLSYAATDEGSGIQTVTLEVDGAAAVTQPLGCPPPHTKVVPCPLETRGSLSLDTATLADGAHTVRVLVTDATGENTAASAPVTIATANTPTSCATVESPGFSVRLDRRGTIAYGGKLQARGTLGGVPAGTDVLVYSQIARAGAPARFGRTPLKTDAAGRFSYRVPAGPSRTLRFAARVPGGLAYSCSKPLKVAVRAPVALSASPRAIRSGQRVRFRGRLRGGHVPANGKVVELQAFERGRWRTFRTVRSSAKGRFSYRYRFSFRAAGTTFPVRARVRADGAYPFALGTSKRVKVRVR